MDPLNPQSAGDLDLDELGGLVGQTLNIFSAPAPGLAPLASIDLGAGGLPPAPQHPLLGAASDVVAQSLDLDLLGTSGASQPTGPAVIARSHTAAPDADVPLFADDVQLGFRHEPPPPHIAAPSGYLPAASSSPRHRMMAGNAQFSLDEDDHHHHHASGSSPSRDYGEGPSTSTGAGAGPSAAAGAAEPAPVRVWIRDPERMEATNKLGMRTSYWTYLVRTESARPGLYTNGTEVRRRFSEFDALHKLVKFQYRGYIIPPLPEKSFFDAKLAHEDFLRLRRADLQAFLRSMVMHPALRDAEALKLFLLQPGELQYNPAWIALMHHIGGSPDGQESLVGSLVPAALSGHGSGSTSAKAAAGISSLVAWVRNSVGSPGSKRELDEDEQQLRHAKDLMRDLERLLQLCCESARVLCGHMESLSTDLYELGRNMGMLSKWEETVRAQSGTYTEAGYSAAKRSTDCKQLSVASARQNTVWKTAAVKTAASLVSLHDYYILIPEAVAALEERERCLEQIHDLEAELGQKQADLNKTTGSSKGPVGGRDRRAYTLTNSVERLDEQLKACRDQYLVIKQRNMEELRRLNLSREQDFHAMMANFATVQSQLMQSSADMWRNTARQFTGEAGAAAGGSGAAQADDEAPPRDD